MNEPTLIGRLCEQLDRLDARFDAHALEEARRDAELLAAVQALKIEIASSRTDFDSHKNKHLKWERRMWGIFVAVLGFFGIQGYGWLTSGSK